MKKQERPEPQLEATLEILDDDDNPVRGTLKLTPEQIADREAEKAGLAAEVRSRIAARDNGVLGGVPEGEDIVHLDPRARRAGARRIEEQQATAHTEPTSARPASRALEAANAAVEEANAELAALEEKRRQLDRQRAETQRAEEEAHQAKRSELQRQIVAAEAEAKRQRLAQAAASLAAQVRAAEIEAERDSRRRAADVDEKNAQLTARVMPVLDRARATFAALQKIKQTHGASLDTAASMEYHWRAPWNNDNRDLATTLRNNLNHMLAGLEQNISNAQGLLSRGWSADPSFPQNVNEVVRLLSYSDEYVRDVEESLARLHDVLVESYGKATPNVPAARPLGLRDAAMADVHQRMVERGQQTRAE